MGSSTPEEARRLAAEAFGTFTLVFAGTAAVVVNGLYGSVTHVGVSLVFGLVVLALIYAVGDVSGAHLNPAVTTAFWLAGRFQDYERLVFAARPSSEARSVYGKLKAELESRGYSVATVNVVKNQPDSFYAARAQEILQHLQ